MAKGNKDKNIRKIGGWKYKLGRGRPTTKKIIEAVYEYNKEYIDKHLDGVANKKRAFVENVNARYEQNKEDRKYKHQSDKKNLQLAFSQEKRSEIYVSREERVFRNIEKNIRRKSKEETAQIRKELGVKHISFKEWKWNNETQRYEKDGKYLRFRQVENSKLEEIYEYGDIVNV